MPKDKKKTKSVLLSVIFGALVLYFGGGVVATLVVNHFVFDHRGSNPEDANNLENRIYKRREDYPSLQNREERHFPGKKGELYGYLYRPTGESKGLVLFAHGMNSLSDGIEIAVENFYVEAGYSLFALDLTGSGKSEGAGMENLYQSALDVASAYEYLVSSSLMENNFVLSGYSWGGFGVSESLSLGVKADKLIAFSAFDRPYDEMLAMARKRVGPVIYASVPPFVFTTWCAYGQNAFAAASDAVKKSGIKGFFVQGENDGTVPLESTSLFNKVDASLHELYRTDATHKTPWLSKNARKYVSDEITPKLEGINRSNIQEVNSFIAAVDKEKSSEMDPLLVERIHAYLGE